MSLSVNQGVPPDRSEVTAEPRGQECWSNHTVQPRQATHSKRKPPLSRAVSHGAMDQLPGMETEWRRNLKLGRIQRQAQVEPGARHVLADALGHTPEQGFLAWFTE